MSGAGTYGKEEAVWTKEDPANRSTGQFGWEGGTGGSSRISGSDSLGPDRADRSRGTPDIGAVVTGGILSQLIESVAEQLAESDECIEWYQRRSQQLQSRLDELRRLKVLNDESADSD